MAQVGPPGAHALQQLLDNHDYARVCSVCEQHELEVRTLLLPTYPPRPVVTRWGE